MSYYVRTTWTLTTTDLVGKKVTHLLICRKVVSHS